jgi:hypothetical protein
MSRINAAVTHFQGRKRERLLDLSTELFPFFAHDCSLRTNMYDSKISCNQQTTSIYYLDSLRKKSSLE